MTGIRLYPGLPPDSIMFEKGWQARGEFDAEQGRLADAELVCEHARRLDAILDHVVAIAPWPETDERRVEREDSALLVANGWVPLEEAA